MLFANTACLYWNNDAILEIKYLEWIAIEDLFCTRRDLDSLPLYTTTEVTTKKRKIWSPTSGLKTHSAPTSSIKLQKTGQGSI